MHTNLLLEISHLFTWIVEKLGERKWENYNIFSKAHTKFTICIFTDNVVPFHCHSKIVDLNLLLTFLIPWACKSWMQVSIRLSRLKIYTCKVATTMPLSVVTYRFILKRRCNFLLKNVFGILKWCSNLKSCIAVIPVHIFGILCRRCGDE